MVSHNHKWFDRRVRIVFALSAVSIIMSIFLAYSSQKQQKTSNYFSYFIALTVSERVLSLLFIMLNNEFLPIWVCDLMQLGFLSPLKTFSSYQIQKCISYGLFTRFLPALVIDLVQMHLLGKDRFSILFLVLFQIHSLLVIISIKLVYGEWGQTEEIYERDEINHDIENQIDNQSPVIPADQNIHLQNNLAQYHMPMQMVGIEGHHLIGHGNQVMQQPFNVLPGNNNNNTKRIGRNNSNNPICSYKELSLQNKNIQSGNTFFQKNKDYLEVLLSLLMLNCIATAFSDSNLNLLIILISVWSVITLIEFSYTSALRTVILGLTWCSSINNTYLAMNCDYEQVLLTWTNSVRSIIQHIAFCFLNIWAIYSSKTNNNDEDNFQVQQIYSSCIVIASIVGILIVRLPMLHMQNKTQRIYFSKKTQQISHIVATLTRIQMQVQNSNQHNKSQQPLKNILFLHGLSLTSEVFAQNEFSYSESLAKQTDETIIQLLNLIIELVYTHKCNILIQSMLSCSISEGLCVLDNKLKVSQAVQKHLLTIQHLPAPLITLPVKQMPVTILDRFTNGLLLTPQFEKILSSYYHKEDAKLAGSLKSSLLSVNAFHSHISQFLPLHPVHVLYDLHEEQL